MSQSYLNMGGHVCLDLVAYWWMVNTGSKGALKLKKLIEMGSGFDG